MSGGAEIASAGDGKLTENITHFARALRRAGLPLGTGRIVDGVNAIEAVGVGERSDFYHALRACFVSRPEHRTVFDQVFRLYWRDPRFLDQIRNLLLPTVGEAPPPPEAQDAERRAAEALLDDAAPPDPIGEESDGEVEFDARFTMSAAEKLKHQDFEQMSVQEAAEARRAIANLRLPIKPISVRRTVSSSVGRIPDWRGTTQASLRSGGDIAALAHKRRRVRQPNLVALCDISGSMASYSRMMLHFLHAASNTRGAGWSQTHAFTFGTRLTNITRHLRQRDPDAALTAAGKEALDWEGGTRIGACLHQFNREWSRRVLSQGAIVLLITDGLDRDDPDLLAREAERLHLSARKLIWLNPLLRWDGFSPKARGVRALLPHVDMFRTCHNLASLEDLTASMNGVRHVDARDRDLARTAA